MAKVLIDVPNSELPGFLRVSEIVKFLEAGRVTIQSDHPLAAESSSPRQEGLPSTRQEGREMFAQRATERGFKIRTPSTSDAGDFVVESESNFRPVRLVCSESPRISLRSEWAEPADLVFAYIWLLPTRTRIFLMCYEEAARILGEKALQSPSFTKRGYYTTAVTPRRQQQMEPFEDRWDAFNS